MSQINRRQILIGAGAMGCIPLTQTARAMATMGMANHGPLDFMFERRMASSTDLVRVAKGAGYGAHLCGIDVGALAVEYQRRWSARHDILIGCTVASSAFVFERIGARQGLCFSALDGGAMRHLNPALRTTMQALMNRQAMDGGAQSWWIVEPGKGGYIA